MKKTALVIMAAGLGSIAADQMAKLANQGMDA